MMFASLILERDPLSLAEVPMALLGWVQVVGLIAAVGLLVHGLVRIFLQSPGYRILEKRSPLYFFTWLFFVYFVLMAVGGVMTLLGVTFLERVLPSGNPRPQRLGDYLGVVVGGIALAIVLWPFLVGLTKLRAGRIMALARVSLKEAMRRRILFLISGILGFLLLFANWFLPYKPEAQISNYVSFLYLVLALLFGLVVTLLGAFGIPTDVKNQSIHTIVTKPVEKFEIVLGRFLGCAILVTAGLGVWTALGLVFMLRGVNPEAAQESMHARVPVLGELSFIGIEQAGKESAKGLNAGRTWDYRSYISGPNPTTPRPRQYAVWSFNGLPEDLATRETAVPFEFTFDVFRMFKGEQNKGIFCTLVFADGRLTLADLDKSLDLARKETETLRTQALALGLSQVEFNARVESIKSQVAAKHGFHEAPSTEVTDYHTQSLEVPAGLFKYLAQGDHPAAKAGQPPPPQLKVFVSVDRTSPSQLLGVARRDLYFLAADNSFWINFIKGVLGIWLLVLMLLAIAIALSTYLSGVISWLTVMILALLGGNSDFITKLGAGAIQGGGPAEAFYRMTTGRVPAATIDDSTTGTLLRGTDEIYRWLLRLVVNLLPDVSRFDLQNYVANGFNIPWGQVLILDCLLPMVGYLLPWAVLAFYLIRFREIANPT